MIEMFGYNVEQLIHKGVHSNFYRGIRISDNARVIIKVLNNEYPTLAELENIKREYRLTNKPYGDKVIKVYGIENYKNLICVVFEDFGAISLSEFMSTRKPDLREKLLIAVDIADAVWSIHRQGVIHKDINPYNILLNYETNELKIIDFGISTDLKSEKIQYMSVLEGTCLYMSPEQTGKINRIIDQRSDLYSVGVTLYELFTGSLPFTGNDLEVIYGHIAKKPIPPIEINNEIPHIISDIIMKLLSKNTEDRYQTVAGLKYDLEYCLENLHKKKKINDYKLAQNDISNIFQIPQKLYGRNEEIGVLKEVINNIGKSKIRLVLISGYAGIGKTSIVQEVMNDIINKGGRFVSGKFEQFGRNIPYNAVITAFRTLLKHLIIDAKNIELLKEKFNKTLGANARVIANLIPELEQITGKMPDMVKLNPIEEKNRFNYAFRDFVKAISDKQTPLIIYLDDIQWSDLSTIELIRYILMSPEIENFVVIGAYRSNEINDNHPLKFVFDEIVNKPAHAEFLKHIILEPLKKQAVNELVADTLKCNYKDTKTLTNYIYQKTKGNPFFTNQLLKSMHDIGAFEFNEEKLRWEWDLKKIEHAQVSDNVIDFLIQNLYSMPDEVLNTVKLASCIGSYFNLRTLLKISDGLENEVSSLWIAIKRELIVPMDNNYRLLSNIKKDTYLQSDMEIGFMFSHDRIQQAAYSLIPEEDKKSIHYRIGRILLRSYRRSVSDSNIFELVNHLNKARDIIKDKEEILELAQLNETAGKKAKSNSAYAIASNYFNIGRNLLIEYGSHELPGKLFEMSYEYAESNFLAGNIDVALEFCDQLLDLVSGTIEKARVYSLKTTMYDLKGESREFILDEIREALKLFDIFLPTQQNEIEQRVGQAIGKMQQELAATSPVELANKLPIVQDENKIAAINLLAQALAAAFQSNTSLYMLIQLTMFEMVIKYGVTNVCCKLFVECGITQGSIFGNYDLSYQFGRASFILLDRLKAQDIRAGTYFIFAGFISHWKSHYSESLEYYDLATKIALENGDIIHAVYSATNKLGLMLSTGQNLNKCKMEIDKTEKFLRNNNAVLMLFYIEYFRYAIQQIQLPYNFEKEKSMLERSKDILILAVLGQYNLMTNYILGNFEAAQRWSDFTEMYVQGMTGNFAITDFYMFQSLALIKQYEKESGEKQNEILQKLNSNLSKLKIWCDNCPDNFAHKYYIVLAELKRLQKDSLEIIMDLYKKALKSIRVGDFINMRALFNEIIGEFWLSRDDEMIGTAYIREAYYFYEQWGASEKIKILNGKYPGILKHSNNQKVFSLRPDSVYSSVSDLDLMSILKASQAISSETKLDKLLTVLLETVIENAGAQNGFVVLKNLFDDNLYIEAIKSRDDEIKIMDSTPINENSDVCVEVLQSVIRTKEPIILEDGMKDEHYQYDEYIKRMNVRSVLCAPIIYQNDLKGIIYLENNLTDNAFSVKQLEVLKMLSSQIAISIEKAQLSQALKKIKDTQKQLVQSEKMASLGNLVSGVAHEINTPVGVAVTAVSHMIGTTENIIKNYNEDNISKQELEDYLNDTMETIELLYMNLNKAASLINGFKRVSADMSNEDKRTFHLKKYINDILLSLSPELKKYKHSIKVVCDDDLEILSYPGVYSQIITNLIINSIMHAYDEDEEGKIEIRVERDGDNIKLIYSDDGRGMDAETKSKIFEPFFTTNRKSGTGLGMHIIFNLVTQTLKGTITCESAPNKGTEFIIEFKDDRK